MGSSLAIRYFQYSVHRQRSRKSPKLYSPPHSYERNVYLTLERFLRQPFNTNYCKDD